MFHKLIPVAAWALLAFIIYATISPLQDRPNLSNSAGLGRIVAFAALGGLFCLAYPGRIVFVCLVVLGSAALLEMVQLLTPDRHSRLLDAIEKMAGGAAGIAAGRAILYFEQANRWFQN
jgi:VanZ family protein